MKLGMTEGVIISFLVNAGLFIVAQKSSFVLWFLAGTGAVLLSLMILKVLVLNKEEKE